MPGNTRDYESKYQSLRGGRQKMSLPERLMECGHCGKVSCLVVQRHLHQDLCQGIRVISHPFNSKSILKHYKSLNE